MLTLLLSLSLSLAPPAVQGQPEDRVTPAPDNDGQDASGQDTQGQDTQGQDTQGQIGELHVDPNAPREPGESASGGYGAVAPLPSYDLEPASEANSKAFVRDEAAESKPTSKFQEPKDFGPFYEGEPTSEVRFPSDEHRPDRRYPFASVSGGTFCFVEDSVCGASLIADADVGVGLNVITSDRGFDVPYTQLRVRGGLTLRPIILAKRRWHPWGIGVVGSWSLASGSITATNTDPEDPNVGVTETDPIQTYRVALINQLWLSRKRNALHLDFTLGAANSSVLDFSGRYWGTTAEAALGFGGWGGLYLAGDFFDGDTRVVLGLRGHALATGPLIALVVLGLVAGGVAL